MKLIAYNAILIIVYNTTSNEDKLKFREKINDIRNKK